MKINETTKVTINTVRSERDQLQKEFISKDKELRKLLMAVSGQEGFIDYEIKEDELILKFPEKKI
jgi:hypothetical protein